MFLKESAPTEQVKQMNPVVLAFVGDAVYSLFIRERLAKNVDKKSGVLSEMAAHEVNASSQAKKADMLAEFFTEEETAIFLRARNAKKPTHAKHSSIAEYNKSTGFEAVLGYLYLSGQIERLDQILNFGETDER